MDSEFELDWPKSGDKLNSVIQTSVHSFVMHLKHDMIKVIEGKIKRWSKGKQE